MKIFHTADWHLGKIVNGFSMLEDQKYILNKMIDSLKKNNIDVLIISGDIYDRSIPPQEAIKLLDDVLYKIISDLKIKILIIPGNHDGAQRLSFANKLYSESGLFVVGNFDKKLPKIVLTDEYGPINFYMLPYFNPTEISNMFEDSNDENSSFENSENSPNLDTTSKQTKPFGKPTLENSSLKQNLHQSEKSNIKTFSQAFKIIIDHNKPFINQSERNILITHGFFGYWNEKSKLFCDQITSPSELSVGGIDIIDLSVASFFDYIALGHLHSPQKVKNEFFRYSGSLLKYSADEAMQQKSCVILDMKEKNNLNLTLEKLDILRDLRIITGYMQDLCEPKNSVDLMTDDYIFVELLDKDVVYDCISRLRQTFKNIIGVKMVNHLSNDNNITINKIKTKDLYTLFNQFYNDVSGQNLDLEKQKIVSEILSTIQKTGND